MLITGTPSGLPTFMDHNVAAVPRGECIKSSAFEHISAQHANMIRVPLPTGLLS